VGATPTEVRAKVNPRKTNRKNALKPFALVLIVVGLFLGLQLSTQAEVKVTIERNDNTSATPAFTFKNIPRFAPGREESRARVVLLDGQRDPNGGSAEVLVDGRLPSEPDEPAENFFFQQGTDGGRLLIELETKTALSQVNTFSWHPGTRGPQVYTLYVLQNSGTGQNERPKRGTDPVSVGWRMLAKVDTRPTTGIPGGQYGVHIFDTSGQLANCRYLLLDISPTEATDAFGNTFYSEIELVDSQGKRIQGGATTNDCQEVLELASGAYKISLDTCETPDLTEWSRTKLASVIREWYPRLVKLLPSEGYQAPEEVTIRFSETMRGVAETSGTRVRCAARWFRSNLQGEAVGSVVHELVHVVQQYGRARRENPEATRSPGWLVEGLADYVRWFLYEPQSHGADLVWLRQRKNLQLRPEAGYRVTANFLDWVTRKYDPDLAPKLNAAMRAGKYREDIWKERTGHTLEELGAEWKQDTEAQLGVQTK